METLTPIKYIQTTAEMAEDWLKLQRLRQEKPELFGLRTTGITTLDEMLGGGVEAGQLVYIGGAPKSGKSTLLKKIATSYGKQGLNYLYVSGEMTNMQMATLIFADYASVNRSDIRAIRLTDKDWNRLEDASKVISELSGYWAYGLNTLESLDVMIEHVEKESGRPLDAMFIDYLQLMEAKTRGTRVQEIEYISRGLKRRSIRKEHPMAIFSASQLNRESIRSKLIDPQAFLGSGALERDMDVGIMITDVIDPINDTVYENRKKVTLVGSRETGIDPKGRELYYNGSLARIADFVKELEPWDSYWKGKK